MRDSLVLTRFLPAVMAILLLSLSFLPATVQARDKTIVIVSTFEDQKVKMVKLEEKARDEITNILVEMKYFAVVERARMEAVMQEMHFSQTAFVDTSTAQEFGRKLGASLVFFGNVSSTGYNVEEIKVKNLDGKEELRKKAKGTATLNIQIVDVVTNQTIFSKSIVGEATDEVTSTSQPKPHTTLIPEAVTSAAQGAWVPIQEAFPLSGVVIKKEKKDKKCLVYVDFGSDWGIKEGRRIYIFQQGEKLIHPITGKVLNSGKGKLVAKDSAAEVFVEYCLADVSKGEFSDIEVGMIAEAQPESFSHGFKLW